MSGIIGSTGSKSGVIGKTELQRFSKNYDRPGDGQYDVDAYTVMLLHADGNGTDASGNGHTASLNGSASFSTSTAKMGTGSLDCNTGNSQNDYFTVASSADFSFGTNPFTIDFWAKIRDTEGGTNLFLIGSHNTAGEIKFRATTNSDSTGLNLESVPTGGGSQFYINSVPDNNIPIDVWFHVALVRTGNVFSLYYNGRHEGKVDNTGASGISSTPIYMGTRGVSTQNLDGCLDEVRISSIARWNSGFTVYGTDSV